MTVTFLLDVDNTLLDNDGLKAWCDHRVRDIVGEREALRFWDLYEVTRHDTGVVDYPTTIERFRGEVGPAVADQIERALVDAPFAEFVYEGALAVIGWLWTFGTVVIFSDGDPVYQPLKIELAGLARAARGNVLVYPQKEAHLDEATGRFPARHYAHVDDKASLLASTKARLHGRVTTVHVRQGHYADDPPNGAPPDITIEHIGELRAVSPQRLGA